MKLNLFSRANSSTVQKTIRIFREEAAKDRRTVWLFATLIPFSHFLYLVLLPLLISFIIQSLLHDSHDITTPLWLIGGIIGSGIVSLFVQHYAFIEFFKHEERITTSLAERAMRGLLAHSQSFFSNQKVGSLAGDVNTFSRAYLTLLDTIFLQGGPIAISFIAGLLVIAVISPVLLIPLTLLTAFIVFESIAALNRRSYYRNKRKELQSKLFGTIADILGNQTLVRMFSKQDKEITTVVRERQEIETVAGKEIDILQRSAEIRMGGLYLFQALTLIVAVYLAANDMVSVAALVFTVTYLTRVTSSMFNINSIIRTSEQAFLDAAKITEVLETAPDIQDKQDAKILEVSTGSIDFDSVDFSYQDAQGDVVFRNLNLSIPAGQSVGLVGKSGGGKSTLTQLLLRYMDIQSGSIKIDGQNIADVTQSSLRSAISYVPQDPYLFHRSLYENVTYGVESASDEAIQSALASAHASEFVDTLPDNLDTVVGERGVKLSGGQRQRIAIARAIVKDSPILLLDEATSALDSESEKYIQSAIETLMKNRTSIVIAHRLSTIAKLDRIIVLENGRIAEDGTHAELIAHDGIYAKLWKHQSGGFIDE